MNLFGYEVDLGLGDLFSLGSTVVSDEKESSGFSLSDLLSPLITVGGGLLGQSMGIDAQAEAADKAMKDKLEYEKAMLELKKQYGLLGGGGGGGSGAAAYAAKTQRAATLAGLYNEMAKQRMLGASQVGNAYQGLTDATQRALLSRGR